MNTPTEGTDPMKDTLCPTCGSGAPLSVDNVMHVTLPRGWPMNDFCQECKNAGLERMREFGRQTALQREKRFMDVITGVER